MVKSEADDERNDERGEGEKVKPKPEIVKKLADDWDEEDEEEQEKRRAEEGDDHHQQSAGELINSQHFSFLLNFNFYRRRGEAS